MKKYSNLQEWGQDVVAKTLDKRTLYEALAEELSEATQASMKIIRASNLNHNHTPVTFTEAETSLREELIDVAMVAKALGILPTLKEINECPKWERWASRVLN